MRLFAYALVASLLGLWGCRRGAIDALDGSTDLGVSADSPPDDAAPDGPRIPCGNATCGASEICLYPPCGCIQNTDPNTDAGACPDGDTYSDALGTCFAPAQCPPPSCVSPAPGTGSFDCGEGDAGVDCGLVNAPIPERCGRVCRAICV